MDPHFIREMVISTMRRKRLSLEDARREIIHGLRLSDTAQIDEVVQQIRQEGRKNQLLDSPPGVHAEEYQRAMTEDARLLSWYSGPDEGDEHWPNLLRRLENGPMVDVVEEIDKASTKVVAHFADPGIRRLKKKGLVVGYVQSGKTANYTAVIAKAVDAGYRTVIVLSGMHNNLRRQTQIRISKDLDSANWAPLTTADADFGKVIRGSALMSKGVPAMAVVKKNASRLKSLRDWLLDIDEDVRARSPILILDDEADQATPNSLAARSELSKINALIREIWAAVPTGSYVGYTATPFANVFMDPSDDEELYPSDFILDLPRSPAYFGAERIFGRSSLDDADEPDPGLDMIRLVPDDEAKELKPPSKVDQRQGFDPELPESAVSAVRWFLIATAIRRSRKQKADHSSMLIHTTAYTAPHFTMKKRVEGLLSHLEQELQTGSLDAFRDLFLSEYQRVPDVTAEPSPTWDDVITWLPTVLTETRVVVDNFASDDRLDYGRTDENGEPIIETVIAIGGGTLSRGLTLEGLIVSYFTRTANTYDTLLQMGRWFGYRVGYEDLPRIWMQESLRADFEFLALVEEEIRRDMLRLESLGVTPREFGIRVRAHPGRMSITAKAKMAHADVVRISYAGQRHQTILLHEADTAALATNIEVARALVSSCRSHSTPGQITKSRAQYLDVPIESIKTFLGDYQFCAEQGLRSDHVLGWINRAAPQSRWNVVFIGTSKVHKDAQGNAVDLGSVDLGLDADLPLVNRAPLHRPNDGIANIKALLSQQDWIADFTPELAAEKTPDQTYEQYRAAKAEKDRGLLIVYGVSNKSVPLRDTQANSRRPAQASLPQIAVGIVFPEGEYSARSTDADYYSVHPDWQATTDEEFEMPTDTEGDATLDANDVKSDE